MQAPTTIKLPGDWDSVIRDFSTKVEDEIKSNGRKSEFWTLSFLNNWRLGKFKYSVCWQNQHDKGEFIQAFNEKKIAAAGYAESTQLLPSTVTLWKDDKGILLMKIVRV